MSVMLGRRFQQRTLSDAFFLDLLRVNKILLTYVVEQAALSKFQRSSGKTSICRRIPHYPCTDPEKIVRGGPTLTTYFLSFLVEERRGSK